MLILEIASGVFLGLLAFCVLPQIIKGIFALIARFWLWIVGWVIFLGYGAIAIVVITVSAFTRQKPGPSESGNR